MSWVTSYLISSHLPTFHMAHTIKIKDIIASSLKPKDTWGIFISLKRWRHGASPSLCSTYVGHIIELLKYKAILAKSRISLVSLYYETSFLFVRKKEQTNSISHPTLHLDVRVCCSYYHVLESKKNHLVTIITYLPIALLYNSL